MAEMGVLAGPVPTHDLRTWSALADLAARGLRHTYGIGSRGLPHTMRCGGQSPQPEGENPRYALISLLGLGRARGLIGRQDDLVSSLWARLASRVTALECSAGDLGLGLWARALHGGDASFFTAARALRTFLERRWAWDSIELAWLMLGADHAILSEVDDGSAEALAAEVKRDLLALYNPSVRLFYRQAPRGMASQVSRRIPCFANQIYPVMALAVHARRTGCQEMASVGHAVADELCRLQGPLGQWWWLYDARLGRVVDSYPVYSVHQDGMAPMALLESTSAGGRSYAAEIERGLKWILGENELHQNLVLTEQGLILRDIHLRGIGRVRRMLTGTLWCCGWRNGRAASGGRRTFEVNRECRPYHLGWLLYAAGLAADATRTP